MAFGIELEWGAHHLDLVFALTAAKEGRRDAATVERLGKLACSSEVVVRGYASWALNELFPKDHSPSEYHVDQNRPDANDANAGSKSMPWRTIQKAAETARAGDTVFIHPGLYREWVRPFFGGKPEAYITYTSALDEEPAVLTAADIWKNEWWAEGNGIYSGPYQRHLWDCPEKWSQPVTGAIHRSEQIIVNGRLLRHVDKRDDLRNAGTFWTDDAASRIWLHLEGDVSPETCLVERSIRQQVFAPAVRGLGYIRVKGLVFRYGAAPEWYGDSRPEIGQRSVVSVHAGHHWLIEDNVIEWGNAQGLDLGTGGSYGAESVVPIVGLERGFHVVRHNRVNHHAVAGIIGTGGATDLLIENNETSYNGWKGNFEGYEAAGIKLHACDRCIISGHKAHSNESFGIWLDWDCRRNRVTRCRMTENVAAGFFNEASPGPLLVDGNVILDTRTGLSGDWGDGIYCHDGNHTTFYGNYVARSAGYGVRLRVLFGRPFKETTTTAVGNRVFNNILVDNRGGVSFHPDSPLFSDNISDANVIWDKHGRAPLMQLEDGGSGVAWENTEIGRLQGRSGGGNLALTLTEWQDVFGQDKTSLILPLKALGCSLMKAESVADLEDLFRRLPQPFPEGLEEVEKIQALPVTDLITAMVPLLRGYQPASIFWLGPYEALQVWRGEKEGLEIDWEAGDRMKISPLRDRALLGKKNAKQTAPRVLSAGETIELPVCPDTRLLAVPNSFTVLGKKGRLTVTASSEAPAGRYRILLAQGESWWLEEIEVAAPLRLLRVEAKLLRAQMDRGILTVPVENRSCRAIGVTVEVRVGEETQIVPSELAPQSVTRLEFSIRNLTAGTAFIRIETAVQTILKSEKISFVLAPSASDWQSALWHNLAVFPDGIFPPGAQAFILFNNGLTARFATRHDGAGLHLRLEVVDAVHNQNAPEWQLYLEDSVEILVKPPPGAIYRGPFLFHLALHSSDQRQILKFRDRSHTAGSTDGPPNLATSLVQRNHVTTTYDLNVPWSMLNLPGAPSPSEDPLPIRLSVLLNNNDGYERHGFQWFFGIFYHPGEDERMGTIWLA